MRPVAPPIGFAETPRGMLVSLPPSLWLAVSLRKSFRGVLAAAEPWTYLVPTARGARLAEWLAEVELRTIRERRARAWTASEAEWSGAAAAPIAAMTAPIAPAIVVLPKRRTARPTLDLLQRMAAGEVLTIADGCGYRLLPSGRPVRASVAARAIGERLIVPGCDGLFGPEWSQTWRSPTQEELRAAENTGRDRGPESGAGRKADRRRTDARPDAGRPHRAQRPLRQAPQAGADGGGQKARQKEGPGVAAAKPAHRTKRSAG